MPALAASVVALSSMLRAMSDTFINTRHWRSAPSPGTVLYTVPDFPQLLNKPLLTPSCLTPSLRPHRPRRPRPTSHLYLIMPWTPTRSVPKRICVNIHLPPNSKRVILPLLFLLCFNNKPKRQNSPGLPMNDGQNGLIRR